VSFLKRPEALFCHAIDLNSKFETNLGLKNSEKLKAFKKEVSLRT
jgi:phosphoribosylanthranilate isomerase